MTQDDWIEAALALDWDWWEGDKYYFPKEQIKCWVYSVYHKDTRDDHLHFFFRKDNGELFKVLTDKEYNDEVFTGNSRP